MRKTDTELIEVLRGWDAQVNHGDYGSCFSEAAKRLEELTAPKDDDRETRGLSEYEAEMLVPKDTVRERSGLFNKGDLIACTVNGPIHLFASEDACIFIPGSWSNYIPTGATLERLRPKRETLREAIQSLCDESINRDTDISPRVWTAALLRILDRFPGEK